MRFLYCFLLHAALACAWGVRGHHEINRAAMRGMAADGPAFLKVQQEYIVALGPVPDSWRTPAEPFLKILEDPNHGWFQEQAQSLMRNPPRSRYEFVLALYREYEKTKDPLTNVRWTGTIAYAAIESYERIQAGMRRYRAAQANGQDTRFIETEIATHIGYLGHYAADAANPMHDSIHHDGWVGENPSQFATDPAVHGRFETAFVDLIQLTSDDLLPRMKAAQVLEDPFTAMLQHIERSYAELEHAYALDKSGALKDPENAEARALVYQLTSSAAGLLRDLVHTAWVRSAERNGAGRTGNPVSRSHPLYNPATGSAPAPRR
ncbi:MAG: hypothetical protein K2X03_13310 [Bryobacteraceae bacterium]|nr:hypothetical protein [Bryobacteraceae bacterium]